MKALVTGASGFVGGWLVRALRGDGWRVTTLDRTPPADIVLDLARDPVPRLSFDAVFHLAAFSSPAASEDDPRSVYEANTLGTGRLARTLRARRFVLASSCHVYGDTDLKVDESAPAAPTSPYAASKLCAEALVLAAQPGAVILRPFNHTGPGQSDAFVCPRVARQIARAEAGRAPRTLEVGDLSPRMDFFDVRDMVRAYLLAVARGRPGETYNVTTGQAVSIRQIVDRLRRAARVPIRVKGREGQSTLRSGDASKFRRDTGWKPLIPLARTLADLLDHERASLR